MMASAGTVTARVRGLTPSGRLDWFISARSDDTARAVLADWQIQGHVDRPQHPWLTSRLPLLLDLSEPKT